jgi:predicted DNA-binding transcriptional regulator YafY
MMAALPEEWREQASSVASRLHIDPVDWYRSTETAVALQEVAKAVWHSMRMTVQYKSWRGESKKEINHLGLVLKAGTWYLMAQAVGKPDVLNFRLANIRSVITQQKRFRRPARFDLAAQWTASTQRFEAELYKHGARIAASPQAQAWLGNARVKAVAFTEAKPHENMPTGWAQFLLPIESVGHGVRQLLGYGAEVKVFEPAILKAALRRELQRVACLYK